MILFWQSKKINGYDCHDCHVLSLIGAEKGITLLSVGILKNSDLWSLYKFLKVPAKYLFDCMSCLINT